MFSVERDVLMKARSQVPETFALPGTQLIQILYEFSVQ